MNKDIGSLIGSRICHDLISPIGAIGNGVELLSLTDGDNSSEMGLITESVENANARIRYFRIAYGAASPDQAVSRAEVLSILSAVARGGRFTYFWQVETDQSRPDVRAAFLMLQCFETAMPLGGDINVAVNDKTWKLTATADRMNMDQDLWETLSDRTEPFAYSPAQVQFALLPDVLADVGRKLKLVTTPTSITATF